MEDSDYEENWDWTIVLDTDLFGETKPPFSHPPPGTTIIILRPMWLPVIGTLFKILTHLKTTFLHLCLFHLTICLFVDVCINQGWSQSLSLDLVKHLHQRNKQLLLNQLHMYQLQMVHPN
ncbi:hypothetical protein AAZX31_04G116900 [Glycine max]